MKRDMNDLALVKVKRPIKFNKFVEPICLPTPDFQDKEIDVFVSGWGTLNQKDCSTDGGPSSMVQCSQPFIWEGNTIPNCLFTNTPSSTNKVCQEFNRANPGYWKKHKKGKVEIKDGQGNLKVTCWDEEPGKHGWCGTCNKTAKPGKPGFCRKRKGGKKRKKRTYARPTYAGDWGWCQEQCLTKEEGRTSLLQEVGLQTLNDSLCQQLGQKVKAQIGIELCAAAKFEVKPPVVYRMLGDRKFEKQQEDHSQKVEKWGGKDSCRGDSGGPLFTWKDDR